MSTRISRSIDEKRPHLQEQVVDLDDVSHYSDNSRIKGLSDGVFSVAMTLLVFPLVTLFDDPSFLGTRDELVHDVLPRLLVYAMSFIILGTYWVGHAIQFHYVIRSDRPLMVRTVLFLFFVSVLPFSTAYLGRDVQSYAPLPIAVYCLNLILCGLFLHSTLLHATKDPLMLHDAMDRRIFRGIRVAYIGGPLLYAVAFMTSFVWPVAAFVLCVVVPVVTFFPNPFWGRLYQAFARVRGEPGDEKARE